jgi:hypothetical protein
MTDSFLSLAWIFTGLLCFLSVPLQLYAWVQRKTDLRKSARWFRYASYHARLMIALYLILVPFSKGPVLILVSLFGFGCWIYIAFSSANLARRTMEEFGLQVQIDVMGSLLKDLRSLNSKYEKAISEEELKN